MLKIDIFPGGWSIIDLGIHRKLWGGFASTRRRLLTLLELKIAGRHSLNHPPSFLPKPYTILIYSFIQPTTQASIQGVLDKARETVVPIAAPGAKGKPSAKSGGGSSAAAAAASAAAAAAAASAAEEMSREPPKKKDSKKEESGGGGGL